MAMYLYGKIYRINTPSPKYVVWVTGVTILPNYKEFRPRNSEWSQKVQQAIEDESTQARGERIPARQKDEDTTPASCPRAPK